ncbi:hypothetical protein [Sorangium sp. So ce388]|uniref:hypothetical protein n=1 Tax=Sorangium sp. So ce388 TaxID=3133309 RepID=UPI003F5B6464
MIAVPMALLLSSLWVLGGRRSEDAKILGRLRESPRTRIDDLAAQKIARLTGEVRSAGERLRAPLSGRSCVYYKVMVEELRERSGWRALFCEQKAVDFLLDDGTGRARVRSAAMRTAAIVEREPGSGDPKLEAFLQERGIARKVWGYRRDLRCREYLFASGDRVTVLGAVSWEQDPDPPSAGKGYRDAAKRAVLSALPEGSLLASDRSDVLQDP